METVQKTDLDDIYEYDNAPSGAIRMYNYKEPFMRNETGFGFQGVLACDIENNVLECSLCGWWGKNLAHHIRREHNYKAKDYKIEFGLSMSSALCTEDTRQMLIEAGVKSSKGKKGKMRTQKLIAYRYRGGGVKKSIQERNKVGTCPAQLLDKIEKYSEQIGRRPSYNEFKKDNQGTMASILLVFGSWNKAIEMLGWETSKRGVGFNQSSWNRESLLEMLRVFKEKHGRDPYCSDARRKLIPSQNLYVREFGSFSKAKTLAFGSL